MNKRIKKKKLKQQFVICDCCKRYTEYYREEDDEVYCPSCYADLVGMTTEEIWRYI